MENVIKTALPLVVHTAVEMQNGQLSGHILHCEFVCCCPGSFRGNTEGVVTRWQRLVAFMKALDLLHQAMHWVSHHRTAMAINMASN